MVSTNRSALRLDTRPLRNDVEIRTDVLRDSLSSWPINASHTARAFLSNRSRAASVRPDEDDSSSDRTSADEGDSKSTVPAPTSDKSPSSRFLYASNCETHL